MENKQSTEGLTIKTAQCADCKYQTTDENYNMHCEIYEYITRELLWGEIKCIYREKKKMIEVYQCELDKTIPLKYIGKVIYIGETFGVEGLTDGNEYFIVEDRDGHLKVVDDSDEDYFYDLNEPGPADGSSPGGKFKILDDPEGILSRVIKNE